jgi:2-polyprenyl-3-methyl-5-hydroxy-6-metoxy-1,4-benzoquinol methylase
MALPSLRVRAHRAVEIMDSPLCDPAMLTRTYQDFRVVNAVVSGWWKIYRRSIRPALSTTTEMTLLDVGSGGGDVSRALARWAVRDGLRLKVTGIDPDARAHVFATSQPKIVGLSFQRALSSDLVADGERFDFVVSNHVLHHLSVDELKGLLLDSEALARRRVLHADLERSNFAYLGFAAATSPFFRHSYIRPDGLTSIQRSYTAEELRAVVPAEWTVSRGLPSRLELRWEAPRQPATTAAESALQEAPPAPDAPGPAGKRSGPDSASEAESTSDA